MIKRWWIAALLATEHRALRLANWAGLKARKLLHLLAIILLVGGLITGSYAVANHVQVASR